MNISDISVTTIITTYNRFEYAKRAIKSVISQSCPCKEIIVVEDSGDSGIAEWIRLQNRKDIIYFRQTSNKGLASARNTGLKIAKGDLIAYLDDDDEWLSTRIEEQLKLYLALDNVEKTKLGCIQVGCQIIDENGKCISHGIPENEGQLRSSIMKLGVITHSSCFMFTKKALIEIDGFDEELGSGIDHDIWMKLAVNNYSNKIIAQPLVTVYMDDRATMMTDTRQRVLGINKYTEKWTPTYQEWFGNKKGEFFAKKYFILVIGGLAGIKFSNKSYREGLFATNQVFQRAVWNVSLMSYAFFRIIRVYVYHYFPSIRGIKKIFLGTNN